MIVFDIDGTLSDCAWRDKLYLAGTEKDLTRFHENCVHDSPIWSVCAVFNSMRSAHSRLGALAIWTGRPERYRAQTQDWLTDCVFNGNRRWINPEDPLFHVPLRMRPEGDFRGSEILKADWLVEAREAGDSVALVFEDREKLVRMYRAAGVTVLQVAP